MKRLRRLLFRKGLSGSGRVFELHLIEVAAEGVGSDGLGYLVNTLSGLDGGSLREGTRTTMPVSLDRAERILSREIQRRVDDGYREVGGTSPAQPPDLADEAGREDDPGSSPAAATVLRYLADHTTAPDDWPETRIIQRAGQLRIVAAVPHLIERLPRAKGLLEIVLAWALARIADPGSAGALQQLAGPKRTEPAQRFATAGLLAIPATAEATRERLLDTLPRGIGRAVEKQSVSGLELALDRHLEADQPDSPLVLVTLALLDTPTTRAVLLPHLGTLPLRPPHWRALRRIYKLAELRDDGEIWGLLAFRIEHTPAQPGTRWGVSWSRDEGQVNIRQASRDGSNKWGFTHPTRQWFRRRTTRSLRIRGNDGCRSYIDLALGVLAASGRRTGRRPSWVVGHILFAHGNVFFRPARLGNFGSPWRRGSEPEGTRTEAFPHLWDARPDALLRLACGGHTAFGVGVGCTALTGRTDLAIIANVDDAIALLNGTDPRQPGLGLSVANALWNPSAPSRPLLLAMVDSTSEAARVLAHGWIRDAARLLLSDADFILQLWLTSDPATHQLAAELLPTALTVPGLADAIAQQALARALANDPEEAELGALRALLLEPLAATMRGWKVLELRKLLKAGHVSQQRLGAELLARHQTPADQLPVDLLAEWTTAADPETRAIGVRVFGTLPDPVLRERTEVILAMLVSPVAEVRAAIAPTVARLAASHIGFADVLLKALFGVLRQAEAAEGVHSDLADFIDTHLDSALDARGDWAILRLLDATATAAQALGARRLGRLRPHQLQLQEVLQLTNHDLRQVRLTATAWIGAEPARYVADDANLLKLIDADWPDTRALGAALLRAHRSGDSLDPSLLIAICDSPRAEVQALGRQLIPDLFAAEHGPLLLARLAEHPSTDMQRFVSGLLSSHAAGHTNRIVALRDYFAAVLGGVAKGGVAKARVFAFLDQQAQRDQAVAELASGLLIGVSASCSVQDRARAIAILSRIRRQYGGAMKHMSVVVPEVREGATSTSSGPHAV